MIEAAIGIAGLCLGALVATLWWLARRAAAVAALANAQAQAASLELQVGQVRGELMTAREDAAHAHRAREAAEKSAVALTRDIEAKQRQFDEQHTLLHQAREQLTAVFKSAGNDALKSNSEQFLNLAKQTFATLMAQAQGDADKKHQAIDNLVKPIRELMDAQGKALKELETKREGAYARINEQIKAIAAAHGELRNETGRLVTALRRPEVRGRWGEMQLRNVVELAGMTPHCDFTEQVSVEGDDGTVRPDMTVRLPGGGVIVIDAKVALQAYLDALQPDADRDACMRLHARQTADHARKLAAKKYWDQFDRAPRIVVMFVPLESALSAALETQPELQSDAMRDSVLITTPISLLGLLRAVAVGWQQEKEAENARRIADTGAELYQRLSGLASAIARVGDSVSRTATDYNKMIGTLEARVLPSARRLKEMQSLPDPEIPPAVAVEIEVRPIVAPALQMLPFEQPADEQAAQSDTG